MVCVAIDRHHGGSVVWTSVDAQELALVSGQWKPTNACVWGSWHHHQSPIKMSLLSVSLDCM